jgi:Tfp pilus assembly protein PilF
VAIAAIGSSLLLVPRTREQIAMDLDAGRIEAAMERLEQAVRAGDYSQWTLATLARAHEEAGDPAGAVRVLETLAHRNPRNTTILMTLLDGYRYVGRLEDQVGTLRQLQNLSPTLDRQRTIVRLEAELGRSQEQRSALEALIERFGGAPQDFTDLARLEAELGRPSAAASTLARLRERYPASVNAATATWEMTLWIVSGQPDRALASGRAWLAHGERGSDALQLADVFTGRQLPSLAVQLLSPFAREGAAPELLVALGSAEYASGKVQAAQRRLANFDAAYGMSSDPRIRLLHLRFALALDSPRSAVAAASGLELSALSPHLLSGLAAAAVRINRLDLAEAINARGETMLTSLDPIVAAQLSLALGRSPEARRWMEVASVDAEGDPVRTVALAGLQLRLGIRDQALATLRKAITAWDVDETGSVSPSALASARPSEHPVALLVGSENQPTASDLPSLEFPPGLLWDMTRLYVQAGAADEAREILAALRSRHRSPDADRAWSFASVMSGRAKDVRTWLASRSDGPLDPALLRDIVSLAMQAGASDLATDAASRLVKERGRDEDRLLMAEVRSAVGRPWTQPPLSAGMSELRLQLSTGTRTVLR